MIKTSVNLYLFIKELGKAIEQTECHYLSYNIIDNINIEKSRSNKNLFEQSFSIPTILALFGMSKNQSFLRS